jgi:hypothetical protein
VEKERKRREGREKVGRKKGREGEIEVNLEYKGQECLRKRERKEERKKWVLTCGEREKKEGKGERKWEEKGDIVGREGEGESERVRGGSCVR